MPSEKVFRRHFIFREGNFLNVCGWSSGVIHFPYNWVQSSTERDKANICGDKPASNGLVYFFQTLFFSGWKTAVR